MSDRIVSIKLTADATGLSQGFNRASDAAEQLRGKVEGTGKSIAASARTQRAEWATVGAGLTAVGVAITGVGVAALKTGISYNTLQQTSRAALTSLLGSAAAANAQMDKLDAFARNSPFAKQTFIVAQQQMLAFGIEAKNVIPYLDAIQNAVAAAGGSNADIEALSEIFGKISSSSKITAIDLQQFGRRGINAAELIGSAMGKTGAEIRTEITAGTLDADAALEALSTGMAEKFAGASDNVKNTFAGAMDRVKAAWRDFASELATPLVDPNGGGALVDLLNWTADMMRGFESLPEPIKNTVSGLTGLVGVTALAGGAAMLVIPQFVAFKDALVSLGVTRTAVQGGLKDMWKFLTSPWGIALLAAGTAIHMFNKQMEESKATAQELEIGLKQGSDAFQVMREEAGKGLQISGIYDLTASVDDLGGVLVETTEYANSFTKWLFQDFDDKAAIENVRELGGVLTGLASTDLPRAQEEFTKFAEAANLSREEMAIALNEMPDYKSALLDVADSSGFATDDTTLLKLALGELKQVTPETVAEAGRLESGLIQVSEAAQEAWKEVDSLVGSLNYFNDVGQTAESQNAKLQQTFADVTEHIRQAKEGVEGYSLSLDASTAEGSKNREMLAGLAGQSQATAEAIFEQELATLGADEATANFSGRLQSGRDQLIETARQFGMTEDQARAFADQVYALPTEHDFKIMAETANASTKVDNFLSKVNAIPSVVSTEIRTFETLIYSEQGLNNKYGKASGGTIGLAHGGTIPGYAGGSTVGFGGGVTSGTVWGRGTSKSDSITVRLSKGEEVIQEPYASLNRPLLKAINRGDFSPSMMQPQVVVQGGGNTQVSLAGATFKASIDGRPFTMMIDEQISGAFTGIGRGSMRRDGGF